ncbi:MAG: methylmalonyl-CoA mutase, partial [Flavobacteriales bacterium]|nr:methylmalonyl-CoA mutase [Flavobacteriales bacterium]
MSEISENNRRFDEQVRRQADIADQLYGLYSAVLTFGGPDLLGSDDQMIGRSDDRSASEPDRPAASSQELEALIRKFEELKKDLDPHIWDMLRNWEAEAKRYQDEFYTYQVRGKEIKVPNHTESLSHLQIPKVALPKFKSWGDKVRWGMQENTP